MNYAEPPSAVPPDLPPAVIVHGLAQAQAALAPGRPVTLLSASGAALGAGVGWWQALVAAARAAHPRTVCVDILDCGDSPGMAMAALRLRQAVLVLSDSVPGFVSVRQTAELQGAIVLPRPPAALDLAPARNFRRLASHLEPPETTNGDRVGS